MCFLLLVSFPFFLHCTNLPSTLVKRFHMRHQPGLTKFFLLTWYFPSLIQGKETAAMKADLLRARNTKRYINQLTVAKKQCEKRIQNLGGPIYNQKEEGTSNDGELPQSQKVALGTFMF